VQNLGQTRPGSGLWLSTDVANMQSSRGKGNRMASTCPWGYQKYGRFPGSHIPAVMVLCCFLLDFEKSKSILFQHPQLLQVLHRLLLSLLRFSLGRLVSVDQVGSTLGFNLL